MNPADCQNQLQKKYVRENWQTLLPQLLPGVELFEQPQNFPLTNDREKEIATARRQFGRATLADGKTVAFYEIDVAAKVDLLRNRVALRELVARCIDEVSAHAVLAFFVQSGNNAYRLTYAAKESRLGGLVDGILAAKRTGDAATVTALETEIDTHVFRLYALTPAEIKLVKEATQK